MNISDLEIVCELATTNCSKTFIARSKLDKRDIVIKRTKPQMGFVFDQEIDALTTLKSPNIVEMIGYDTKRKEIYLEHVKGTKLSTHIESNGPIPVETAIELFRTISQALQYIHSSTTEKPEFVHYDISDENFILTNSGAKLLDFGASYRLNKVPQQYLSEEVGTLYFMSPEKLKHQPEHGKASDVYAFGVIAYKILTGMPPFLDCVGCMRTQILKHHPLPINSNNPRVDTLVLSCLEKSPQNRPTAEQLHIEFSNHQLYK
jgi:eukaryotic-like serine/threonine-protein kinase